MIVIENLSKTYHNKHKQNKSVLNAVSLTLPSTGFYTFVGPSGSGKTTIFNIVGGIDTDYTGRISSFGYNLSDVKSLNQYRNSVVSYVFQDFNLVQDMTIYENLALPLYVQGYHKNEIYNKINGILVKLGLIEITDSFPMEVSGGELQRIAIARALVKNSEIIMADEPTGNLDEHNAREILKILHELSKNMLVILVTHNLEYANEYSDSIIEISELKNTQVIIPNTIQNISTQKSNSTNSRLGKFQYLYPLKYLYRHLFSSCILLLLFSILIFIAMVTLKVSSISETQVMEEYLVQTDSNIYEIQRAFSSSTVSGDFTLSTSRYFEDVYSLNDAYKILQEEYGNLLISSSIYFLPSNDELKNAYINFTSVSSSTRLNLLNIDSSLELRNLVGNIPESENEIVVTDFLSVLIFGTTDSIGQTVSANRISPFTDFIEVNFKIVGIIQTDYLEKGILDKNIYDAKFHYSTIVGTDELFTFDESNIYIQCYALSSSLENLSAYYDNLPVNFIFADISYSLYGDFYDSSIIIDDGILGSIPATYDEVLVSSEILEDLFAYDLETVYLLEDGSISWNDFLQNHDISGISITYDNPESEEYYQQLLPNEFSVVGVFLPGSTSIAQNNQRIIFSSNLIQSLNSEYPYSNIGLSIIWPISNPEQLITELTSDDFLELHIVRIPHDQQMIINGRNSYAINIALHDLQFEIQPLLKSVLIVTSSFLILFSILSLSFSLKLKTKTYGTFISLGIPKKNVIFMICVEFLYVLTMSLVVSNILFLLMKNSMSEYIFPNEIGLTILDYISSDYIMIISYLLLFFVISVLPNILYIASRSPLKIIRTIN